MTTAPPDISIQPATPAQRAEALLLLLCELPSAERTRQAAALLAAARAGAVSMEHLLVACRGTRIEGVVWANALEGGLAAIWAPQLSSQSSQHDDIARALVRMAETRVAQGDEIALWQASLDIDSSLGQQRLAAAGYQPLAILAQLLAVPTAVPEIASSEPLSFEPYQAEDFARLCNLIDATYVATLDCPELDSLRVTADSVTGYRAIGNSAEEHWYFVQHLNLDVGCLLLAEHDAHQFELVYMGLVRECRGQRWGRLLVAEALQIARDQGATALTTSVDERNLPALAVYQQAGFSTWARRQVMFKPGRS